jgi:hypothetical protein
MWAGFVNNNSASLTVLSPRGLACGKGAEQQRAVEAESFFMEDALPIATAATLRSSWRRVSLRTPLPPRPLPTAHCCGSFEAAQISSVSAILLTHKQLLKFSFAF